MRCRRGSGPATRPGPPWPRNWPSRLPTVPAAVVGDGRAGGRDRGRLPRGPASRPGPPAQRSGWCPTMGALHAGHVSLMARARAECDTVAVSIFVNPLQFGDPEDIAHYPRTLDWDLAVCAEAGVDVVFVPSVTEMYPRLAGSGGHHRVGAGRQRGVGGRVAPGAFRRRGHGRGQALLDRRALPGLFRREGLPAAGGGPPDGGRPLPAGRR